MAASTGWVLAAAQRSRSHKLRNVLGHLPRERREQARATWRAAGKLEPAEGPGKSKRHASRLELERPSAAASLRGGLAELFAVHRPGLSAPLRRCLAAADSIDSPYAGVRRRTQRVGRWRCGGWR